MISRSDVKVRNDYGYLCLRYGGDEVVEDLWRRGKYTATYNEWTG